MKFTLYSRKSAKAPKVDTSDGVAVVSEALDLLTSVELESQIVRGKSACIAHLKAYIKKAAASKEAHDGN
jgi:uncharacterized small protein (DUF1192 family)